MLAPSQIPILKSSWTLWTNRPALCIKNIGPAEQRTFSQRTTRVGFGTLAEKKRNCSDWNKLLAGRTPRGGLVPFWPKQFSGHKPFACQSLLFTRRNVGLANFDLLKRHVLLPPLNEVTPHPGEQRRTHWHFQQLVLEVDSELPRPLMLLEQQREIRTVERCLVALVLRRQAGKGSHKRGSTMTEAEGEPNPDGPFMLRAISRQHHPFTSNKPSSFVQKRNTPLTVGTETPNPLRW